MEEYKNNGPVNNQEEGESISLRDIFDFVWRLKWWIAASAFAALILGFVYVRMQTPIYERTAWVMLNRDDGSTGELSVLSQMTGNRTRKKIDNELFILRSPSLMKKVVEELNLNSRYFQIMLPVGDQRVGWARSLVPFSKTVEFYRDNPIEMRLRADSLQPVSNLPQGVYVMFKHLSDGNHYTLKTVTIDGREQNISDASHAYGDTLTIANVEICIAKTQFGQLSPGSKYVCSWVNSFNCAEYFVSKLSAEAQDKKKSYSYLNSCDVVMLRMSDNLPARAVDILNTLITRNNEESMLYSNQASINTIRFIDERLADISRELGRAEQNVKDYQSRNSVVDINSQSSITISSDMQYRNQLSEVQVQKRILSMIDELLKNEPEGEYSVIPAIGVSDVGLNAMITKYNDLVSERNRLIANSSASNPA